jgi:hypothetical protein
MYSLNGRQQPGAMFAGIVDDMSTMANVVIESPEIRRPQSGPLIGGRESGP